MPHFRRLLGLLFALFPLLALAIVFMPAAAAPLANIVTVGNGHASDCTQAKLGDAMNNNTDATIVFNCGGPATIPITQSGGLNVVGGQHFTIQGADVITLTGLSAHRLFYVQAGSALTLTHIVLTHGFDFSSAGAILQDSSTYLALDHVTLSDNQSLGSGGAIEDDGGTLKVANSLFDHNRGTTGGAIFSAGALTTTNTTFSNNSASLTGGALELVGPTAISGGQVSANAAALQGGALHINSAASVTVDHVSFDGNYTLTPTVDLKYNGGAIHTAGPLTVTNSSFTRNSAVYGGALFDFNSPLYLANDTLSGNSAVANGGALSNDDGVVNIYTSTLTLNSAANGGAVHNNDVSYSLTLWNTAVLQNTAGVLGGGIYAENGLFVMQTQSSLNGNKAQVGGGLYVKTGGEATLLDAFVEDNMATNANGGGLYLEHGAQGRVDYSTLWGNTATGSGGAIDNESDAFSLLGSMLAGNTAGKGAGLYNTGSGASVDSSTFQRNAADVGGGLDNDVNGALRVIQSTLAFNTADFGAGALNNGPNTQLYLENSTLSGNIGTSGGALDSQGAAALRNVTVANNEASTGGGLYIEPGAQVVLTNTLLAYSTDGGNCIGTLTAAKYSASSDNTCLLSGNINGHSPNHLDPLLTGLGNYGGPTLVHMLMHNSPVLDGVGGSDAPDSDQRGFLRPKGLGFDLGAVERQPTDSDLAPWVWLPLARR